MCSEPVPAHRAQPSEDSRHRTKRRRLRDRRRSGPSRSDAPRSHGRPAGRRASNWLCRPHVRGGRSDAGDATEHCTNACDTCPRRNPREGRWHPMTDERQVFERVMRGFVPPDDSLERLRRRDRKRRNQRIAAGVVGIAAFVAAVWIATSVASLDRSEKSVVPAGTGPCRRGRWRPVRRRPDRWRRGPTETGPAESAPVPALASGAPHVVRQGGAATLPSRNSHSRTWGDGSSCGSNSIGARRAHLADRDPSRRGHHGSQLCSAFAGIRVAGDSGDFSVQLAHSRPAHSGTCGGFGCPADWFKARATDMQTDQPLQGVGPNRVTAPRRRPGSNRIIDRRQAVAASPSSPSAASREPAPHGEPAV